MRSILFIFILFASCPCYSQVPKPFILFEYDSTHTYWTDTIRSSSDSTFVNVKQYKGDTLIREEGQIWIKKVSGINTGNDTLFHYYTLSHGTFTYHYYQDGIFICQLTREYRYGEMKTGFIISYSSGAQCIYNGATFDFVPAPRPGHSY